MFAALAFFAYESVAQDFITECIDTGLPSTTEFAEFLVFSSISKKFQDAVNACEAENATVARVDTKTVFNLLKNIGTQNDLPSLWIGVQDPIASNIT